MYSCQFIIPDENVFFAERQAKNGKTTSFGMNPVFVGWNSLF